MRKRNIYIVLTIICILSLILIDNLPTAPSSAFKKTGSISPEKIPAAFGFKNPILIFASLLYAFIFFAGLINLGLFFIRKIKGYPITTLKYPKKELPLNQDNSAELIFSISFLTLLTYLLPGPLLSFSGLNPIYIILGANYLFQIGTILIIFNYLKPNFFDFRLKKKELGFLLETYTALTPILVASIFINLFLLKSLGIEPPPSPLIKLIPLINTKTALFLFASQVIFIAPFAEELIFRGIFYKLLRKKYSFFISAAVISLFFAFLHRSPSGIIGLFAISFTLCYVYETTQKIGTAFVFHALHNAVTLLFFLGTKL
ncbi:MAG: CPBP family intramembrane metalloprotease [Candidatus Omnitrophica bacterium]|nr:CPBP family intramembrane metalloprotease [Candidatus Omnitrophota bacterium]